MWHDRGNTLKARGEGSVHTFFERIPYELSKLLVLPDFILPKVA